MKRYKAIEAATAGKVVVVKCNNQKNCQQDLVDLYKRNQALGLVWDEKTRSMVKREIK